MIDGKSRSFDGQFWVARFGRSAILCVLLARMSKLRLIQVTTRRGVPSNGLTDDQRQINEILLFSPSSIRADRRDPLII